MTRSGVWHEPTARALRSALLKGSSITALAVILASTPAHAQLAGMRAALGVPANVGVSTPTPTNTVTAVTPTMNQILARHHAYEARVQQAAGLVAQANAAARAAAKAAANSVPDGLAKGGLDPVVITLTSAQDPTGLSVWEGAGKPTQTQNGSAFDVTVNQTQSRALLSWNSFNVGASTTLTFNQQGNADWVVVNRVVGGIGANGLLDPSLEPSPSQILGSIKADGSVYILNRAGVMFGATAQVNLHSLLASSLELGSATIPETGTTLRTLSLQERNDTFLAQGLLPAAVSALVSAVADEQHGNVNVAAGAQINANGGYVILAARNVSSGGEIKTTVGGQVSLQAGTQVDATVSSGAADSLDPYVRGLILTSVGGGSVEVTGSIDAPQGYIALGTDQAGSVTMGGVLTSTTSVARNGKISLIGGTVEVASGAAIAITPDTSGATIPQSAESVAAFKTSQIDIGSQFYEVTGGRIAPAEGAAKFALLPADITIGANATIEAPSADVSIGGRTGDATRSVDEVPAVQANVDIGDNAVIDVSGVADYQLDASRNVLEISPAKRNELRDTPIYRDPTTDGSFTLNGQTLFIDPRLSGVRADGVAWIGSPLIEAGSLASQIGVTAPELMTPGGTINIATLGFRTSQVPTAGAYIPRINIASSAVLDFSGGWVRYAAGSVHYSKLLTSDGRLIDISQADPNDDFVAVGDGFVEQLPQLSDPTVYANSILQGTTFEPSYVEGRDAGALTIKAPTGSFNGELHGDAVAGVRQIGAGQAASATSTIAGDIRKLQATGNQLPSAGLLHIQSIPGADIVLGDGENDGTPGTVSLDAAKLDAAHLGAVSLQTTGRITVDASADLHLAAGGAFNADAGRTITFDGDISAPAGSISARTYGIRLGNIFDASDDLPSDAVLTTAEAPRMFDIVVNDGAVLSTRGRWVNDSLVDDPLLYDGPGYTSGGSITLVSAPHIEAFKADGSGAVDLSGSILLKSGSLLDVSGGGYISSTGTFGLSGKGGNVSLINETSYFQSQTVVTQPGVVPKGSDLFRSDLSSFQVTPSADGAFSRASVPDAINATVQIDGDIRSFGFKGGGTFTLVTPDLKFGSSDGMGTYVPLDFLDKTGFGTLSLSAWNTAIIDNVFSNGLVGKTGLLATDLVQIRDGETLNLTQSILPSILTTDQANLLATQATGTDISRLAEIAPTNQLGDWDNLPANLILGGVTELDVLGGTITGAPTASITAPKIYNAGTIRIAGGSILQKLILPTSYVAGSGARSAIGIHQLLDGDGVDRGAGLSVVFGDADSSGKFDENAPNALGISSGAVLTNRQLVAQRGNDRQIYYLGLLESDQGILFAPGSLTDLSGTSIRNPRAALLPGSTDRLATGRLVAGGTIRSASLFYSSKGLFSSPGLSEAPYDYFGATGSFIPNGSTPALQMRAEAGATIDLSGASDTFDILTGPNSYTPTPVWSNAGRISALGGGDVSDATIDAHGGSPEAQGGTFEWLNPVLVQGSSDEDGVVSADQLETAGFDTFIGRGDVTTIGDVDLTLGRGFLLRARDYSGAPLSTIGLPTGDTLPYADPYYAISMGATGDLSITAPHIALIGIDQTVASLDATGEGSLALHGGSIDLFGGVAFRNSLTNVLLDAQGDIRLIGVQPLAKTLTPDTATDAPSLSGQVIAGGDLTFRAAQVYATTGSGNLQQLTDSDGAAIVRPFVIGSAGADATIRFEGNGTPTPPIRYSAGSYLRIVAPNIEQAGVLRAPLGRIDLGSTTGFQQGTTHGTISIGATESVTLEPGSITSVSLGDLKVPYGTTTDLTDYFFSPLSNSPLTAPPAAELRFGGDTIAVLDGATVDASGGTGDVYGYEFVSGTGGSRDVLSRFNSDAFSSTNGYQYPDGRQVYAIVPVGSAEAALYDPIYSADYASLYGTDAGKIVRLEGGNGVAAGDYMLLPGQYAMLPGAMRLVENVGAAAPLPGQSAELRDGSIIVAGTYGTAGTDQSDWQRRSFTVQSQSVFSKYSRIELTSGTERFTDMASGDGRVLPRLPADAARLVFKPKLSLITEGNFDTDPAEDGRGSDVDIAAEIIDVVSQVVEPHSGALTLVADDLGKLNAASLFLGGVRTDLADGSTDLEIAAHEINILNDVDHPLSAPEVLLAVDGIGSKLNVADGASIVATGTLTNSRDGDYNVASYTVDSGGEFVSDNSGAGAVLRLANGPERLINRSGALAASVTTKPVTFTVGQANLVGDALALDTSRQLDFDAGASLDVHKIAISGDNVSFSSRTYGIAGLVITPELEQTFAVADKLTIRANATIGFTAGDHNFRDLTLYAPGVRLIRTQANKASDPLTVTLNADNLTFGNKTSDAGACRGTGGFTCGTSGNAFVVNADTLTFEAGVFHTYGFDAAVDLTAANGSYYNGVGAFDVGAADLSLTTPFLVDRGTGAQPKNGEAQADLELRSTGDVVIARGGTNATPTGPLAPGSRLAIGSLSAPANNVTIDGTLLRATAGTIEAYSDGDVSLLGDARLEAPSYAQQFGDAADPVTVSANGGTISLVALNGDITLGNQAMLAIGGTTGRAGKLDLLASRGAINLAGTIDSAAPGKGASLNFDAGLSSFDLPAFLTGWGSGFTGALQIRTGVGDLQLNAGQTLAAESVKLTADGGSTVIGGTIDTSGVNGGDIGLYARDAVGLLSSAVLDAHADGYEEMDTRRASGGDVTLGVGQNGVIDVAGGAAINVAAVRPGDRLVPGMQTDPRTLNQITAYTYVEGDQGGTLTLRAPVINQNGADTVDIDFAAAVDGARDVSIQGYRSYDLGEIAANPAFSGVTVNSGVATLDLAAAVAGKNNFLADPGAGTLVDFIQNFDISSARSRLGTLPTLSVYHERPGVELDYDGDITLASNWNLGAGWINNIQGALDAGDIRPSALGAYADDSPRYEVVPGHEAHLFQNFVSMTYRVGGKVDGEAGVLTLRAGRNLNINHSITDGFFSFSDQTDPDYISSQLGGGLRFFHPAITVQCGVVGSDDTCDNVVPFDPNEPVQPSTSINFNLTAIVRGAEEHDGIAPYSAAANSPAALGLGVGGAGDPIGSAQLFPLLDDGTPQGNPVEAFSIQLVGGAGPQASANPLHIDRASGGDVVVSGETTYAIKAVKPTADWDGSLQLRYGPGADNNFISGNFLSELVAKTGLDEETLSNSRARVQYGQVSATAAAFMKQAAQQFFAAYPDQVEFLGPKANPTGFTAPVGLVIQFLESKDASGLTVAQRFAAKIDDGSFGYKNPAPFGVIDPPGSLARVRSLVRTGTGSIDVAAAGDVNLTNGDQKLLSANAQGALGIASNAAQAGGAPIYTVGHIVAPTTVAARVAGTQTMLAIDPAQYVLGAHVLDPYWVPTSTGRLQLSPVYATGGGSISLTAGEDILGRRDAWSEAFNSNEPSPFEIGGIDHHPSGSDIVGSSDQRWRIGSIGVGSGGESELATNIRINPQLFSSGIGTLGGGDVSIDAGHDVSELTVALDTSVTTGNVGNSFGSMVFGGGNLDLHAGHDILGGRFDIAAGKAEITARRDITSSGQLILRPQPGVPPASIRVDNLPEIRLTDAQVDVTAGGSVRIGKISALGVDSTDGAGVVDHGIDANALGYFTGRSEVAIRASGNVALAGEATNFWRLDDLDLGTFAGAIMPASLEVASFNGDLDLGKAPLMLYPGATGQLSLLAGGTVAPVTIDLDDGDASLMPGIFSALNLNTTEKLLFAGRPFSLPVILPGTSDLTRQLYHSQQLLHDGDAEPVRIAVGGDLVNMTLFSAKSARISAGGDIVNMMFVGQNIDKDDVTRIVAGGDIKATVAGAANTSPNLQAILGRSIVQGNQFILGGLGSFYVEAGRNLGPFLGSSTIIDTRSGTPVRAVYPGGILAVGNDFNPWLPEKSADIYAFFGVAKGMDFAGLRETYVNPANVDALDGDLFEQVSDAFGNKSPDRTKPIYAKILVDWMRENEADALIASFGSTDVTAEQAYDVFAALPELVQRKFLLEKVYFNELEAPSRPEGPSYLQYVRGYRAVDALFPASLGYTANDLSGDHNGGTRVNTGNLDLRLATIQTTRGGDITILGPGGDAILGSVVRTSAQAARRAFQPTIFEGFDRGNNTRPAPTGASYTVPVVDIPIGYEGVLTLRGGAIRGFTDGDFRLNQSRLFTQQSGDITLWSSNGDLNAGQGPKSAANVPPVVVRFDLNGFAEVDRAGSVAGAGIAGFTGIRRRNASTGAFELVDPLNDSDMVEAQTLLASLPAGSEVQVAGKTYRKDAPTITLIAPVGTVDAGDAGVRAGGDIFVAAAQVANADNFKVGGQSIGIPSLGGATAPPTPANAASALTANVFRATNPNGAADQRVRILVDVLGYYGSGNDNGNDECPSDSSDPNCKKK